jgi:hypothetical protein
LDKELEKEPQIIFDLPRPKREEGNAREETVP